MKKSQLIGTVCCSSNTLKHLLLIINAQGESSISIHNGDMLMEVGDSADIAKCKFVKQDGTNCVNIVDKVKALKNTQSLIDEEQSENERFWL